MTVARRRLVGVFCLSLATLAFEIALTRIFAVAQWYHFAFLSVSTALLGFGASGSLLTLFSSRLPDAETSWARIAFLFSLGILGSYLLINYLPFDSYRIAWEPIQFLYLAIYYLALALPFLLSGLIIGALLAANPEQAPAIYGANLIGSAAGCLAALGLLPWLGGSGTIVATTICGLLGTLAFGFSDRRERPSRSRFGQRLSWTLLAMTALTVTACLIIRPAFLDIKLSPYKALSQALRIPEARIVFTAWNAFSRVDIIESPAIRSAPGLSLTCPAPLPPQMGLTLDGGNLQPITRWTSPADVRFGHYLPTALPYLLIPESKALIIEPRGGLSALVALQNGARSIVVVESNPLVIHAVRDVYGGFAGHLYSHPHVQLASEEGRTYLHRSRDRFDIIEIALADSYQPVTSGAYSLSESYLYTTEAFVEALQHLAPGGILAATRWLQVPPSEEVRLGSLAVAALGQLGIGDARAHVMAFRSWSTATVLVKRQAFSSSDVERLRDFCNRLQYDPIYYPGMTADEANRYHIFPKPIYHEAFTKLLGDLRVFYADSEYDVSPPTDNRPFFFHFFKWRQIPNILRMLGKTWQPFGGSGYLVLLFLLAIATLVSGLLILLPLFLRGHLARSPVRGRVFVYFAALGLGYLFVELALVQRFILFLGRPVYAFAAVLFALLLFSGWGSLMAPRTPWRTGILCLVATIWLCPLLLPSLFNIFLDRSLAMRLLITVISLAPLGFFMGLPFTQGLAIVNKASPALIPWAWGINGCASVLASILATLFALSWGFRLVMVAGSVTYLAALIAFWPLGGKRLPGLSVSATDSA